jgi:hypothetical protein
MRDWLIVNWLSLLAFLVALTSLLFAYSAYTHVHGTGTTTAVAASTTNAAANAGTLPKVTFMTGEDREAGQAGIEIKNGGPSLAIIKSVDYFIDGRRMDGEEAVIEVAPRGARNALQYTHLNAGARIAANTDTWLLFLPRRDTKPREYERVANFLTDSVAVGVKYCSEQNACADACSKTGACGPQK